MERPDEASSATRPLMRSERLVRSALKLAARMFAVISLPYILWGVQKGVYLASVACLECSQKCGGSDGSGFCRTAFGLSGQTHVEDATGPDASRRGWRPRDLPVRLRPQGSPLQGASPRRYGPKRAGSSPLGVAEHNDVLGFAQPSGSQARRRQVAQHRQVDDYIRQRPTTGSPAAPAVASVGSLAIQDPRPRAA